MPGEQGAWWVFTRNFEGDVPILNFPETVQFSSWQHERVSHDHLQGVIQFKSRKTSLKLVKAIVGGNAHIERMRTKDPQMAIDYSQKEESRVSGPWIYGEYIKKGSNKRKIMEKYEEDPEEMKFSDPDLYLRCNAHRLNEEYKKKRGINCLKPWQIEVHNYITSPPGDRSIIWVYGYRGGEGKSTFAKELIKKGWFYSSGGKTENVLYLYSMDPERHVVFDFPRCSADMINYQVLEMIKNGVFSSTKYRPVDIRVAKDRHVLVFANQPPNSDKLSEDRLLLVDVNSIES